MIFWSAPVGRPLSNIITALTVIIWCNFVLTGSFDNSNLIVLNHAFRKKSQKTPLKVIRVRAGQIKSQEDVFDEIEKALKASRK